MDKYEAMPKITDKDLAEHGFVVRHIPAYAMDTRHPGVHRDLENRPIWRIGHRHDRIEKFNTTKRIFGTLRRVLMN